MPGENTWTILDPSAQSGEAQAAIPGDLPHPIHPLFHSIQAEGRKLFLDVILDKCHRGIGWGQQVFGAERQKGVGSLRLKILV